MSDKTTLAAGYTCNTPSVRREAHSSKSNLDWVVRLVWFPEAIRPIGPRQIYEGSVGGGVARTGGLGYSSHSSCFWSS